MPDPTPSPGGDWGFPPVEPAPPYRPQLEPQPGPAPSAGVMPVPRRQPSTAPPVSPLRAVAGAAVAVAGVLLGIGALLWATDAPKGSPAVQPASAQSSARSSPSASASRAAASAGPAAVALALPPATPPSASPSASPPAPAKLALTVLNNSNRTGLAKRAAGAYAAAGWPIALTGSFRGRVSESTVYYAPGQQPAALALQRAFPAITRVRPRFVGLPGSGLTVVLVRTYPA